MGADAKQERVLQGTAQEVQGNPETVKEQGQVEGRQQAGLAASKSRSASLLCSLPNAKFGEFKCSVRNVSV